jgi:hypothetical protein
MTDMYTQSLCMLWSQSHAYRQPKSRLMCKVRGMRNGRPGQVTSWEATPLAPFRTETRHREAASRATTTRPTEEKRARTAPYPS